MDAVFRLGALTDHALISRKLAQAARGKERVKRVVGLREDKGVRTMVNRAGELTSISIHFLLLSIPASSATAIQLW
jgi:hypothetical protein